MSDKLKIMQSRIDENQKIEKINLHSTSIGYPNFKTLSIRTSVNLVFDCEQSELDTSAFRDYIPKAEYVALTSFQ